MDTMFPEVKDEMVAAFNEEIPVSDGALHLIVQDSTDTFYRLGSISSLEHDFENRLQDF